VKRRVALYFVSFFLFRFLMVADNVTAQTIGYRQTNLAANLSSVADNVAPDLVDPWGCEIFVYPGADHGYAQPLFNEGKNYNPEAVRTTWILVEDFLASHLRP
jgi:dienelactone hydrolase